MIKQIKKILITYHREEILSLEQRQDSVLHLCTSKAAKEKGIKRKLIIDESMLMINGLGRKIRKHQRRIEQLTAYGKNMSTLERISQRINRLHSLELEKICKNTANTLDIAPLAAELTDKFSEIGLEAALYIAYTPTLFVLLPENGEQLEAQLARAFLKIELHNWLQTNGMKSYEAQGAFGKCHRLESEPDFIGRGGMTIDIIGRFKK